jgi:Mce-associated membrane protein
VRLKPWRRAGAPAAESKEPIATTDVANGVSDDVENQPDAGAPSKTGWHFHWPPSGEALIALVVAAALLVGATIWLGLLVRDQHTRNDDRTAALAGARRIVTDYSTYDYNNADAQFQHLATEFTGPLKAQIQHDLASVVSLVKSGKGTGKGQVRDAAVVLQHGKNVSVIAVIDQAVTNTAIPKGELRRYRFRLVMQQVHGHWYATSMELT